MFSRVKLSPFIVWFAFLNFYFLVIHYRPAPNFGDAMGDRVPPTAWHPMSPQNVGPTSNPGIRSMGSQLLPRSADLAIPLNPVRMLGWHNSNFYCEIVLISHISP